MAKAIKVVALIVCANAFFVNSPASASTDRIVIAGFLSGVLHETGNYAGFNYLTPYGEPGNDPTRVVYFKHRNLG